MSTPITIDIEVASPVAVALEIATPVVDVTPNPDGAQVVVVATPGPPGPPGAAEAISQVVATGVAAGVLSGHHAVTRRTDGEIEYASNTNPAHLHAPIWITTGASSAGAEVTAVAYGLIDEPTWTWTPGPVFLGTTGALTQTAPTAPDAEFLAQIGTATSATSVFVDRNPSFTLA